MDENSVKVSARTSHSSFNGKWGLYENYHVLHRDGWVQPGENVSAYSLSMGFILYAVPNEVTQEGLGLKLKNNRLKGIFLQSATSYLKRR